MLVLREVPDWLAALSENERVVGSILLEALKPHLESLELIAGTDLIRRRKPGLYYVERGAFAYRMSGGLSRFHVHGDWIELEPRREGIECRTEFAAFVQFISTENLFALIKDNGEFLQAYLRFRDASTSVLRGLAATAEPDAPRISADLHSFSAGAVILKEGQTPDGVYELIDGRACATLAGREIGMIREGEIFGEVSFFTESPRTATVTAVTDCLVQKLSPEGFFRQLAVRPQLSRHMLQALSRRLANLNDKVAGTGDLPQATSGD